MRKGRFWWRAAGILASTVASHKLRFRFHGSKLSSGTVRYAILVQPADFYFAVVSMAYLCRHCAYDEQENTAAVVLSTEQQLEQQIKNDL